MIKFPCRCGHPFAVEDDSAGLLMQCPRCGILNDVPTQQELQNMAPDGTILLDIAPPIQPEPGRLQDLKRAFAKEKVDEFGREIDLRNTREDYERIGLEPETGKPAQPPRVAVKYDPETGERIREHELAHHPDVVADPSSIPVAKPTLDYARQFERPRGAGRSFIELWKPLNLATMFFVLLAHAGIVVFTFFSAMGLLYVSIVWILLLMAVFAHYVNVVVSTGPDDRDELPRFMGDFSFIEDLWKPFCSAFAAFFFCFAPAVAVLFVPGPPVLMGIASLGMASIGFFFLPAAYLTCATSGTLVNLRPDRMLGVVGELGGSYFFILGLLCVGIPVYLLGFFMSCLPAWDLGSVRLGHLHLPGYTILIGLPLLVAGIFLIHCFAWELGIAYRLHHERFPWVFQYHVRTPRPGPLGRPIQATKTPAPRQNSSPKV